MSLDGIFLKSITDELQDKLINARVDKIYQPDKNEIVLLMRSGGENCKLLMTSISSSPRIHLTDSARKNPEQPPMFCMLLRKHLTGAHVKKIEQMDFDRIVEITFECKDELETSIDKSLIIEIMGKHSNIIFINKNTGTIIDSIRRVAESMSSVRQVMPGLKYEFPPSDKINPLKVTREKFLDVMNKENEGTIIFNFIYKTFTGMSPFISSEICFLAGVYEGSYMGELDADRKDKVWKAFESVIEKVRNKNYKFQIYLSQDENTEFYCLDLENMKNFEKKQYGSAGELLDTYYLEQDNKNKINQRISSLVKSLTTKLERDKKKVEKQRGELLSAEDREKYKIYGELIIANLNKKPENSKLIVTNYYDPEQKEIAIPLDPKLNLAQNSQKFFKRYSKLKSAEEELRNLIASSSDEIKYLENILFSIEECSTTDDLEDIINELTKEGLVKKKGREKKAKEYKPEFLTYVSSGGHDIAVGRNNLQNDLLTFRIAKKEDFWFHAKDMPGSHVIIRTNGDKLKDEEYIEAARVAAFYSKGKNSGMVEVDYTKKLNVKKPPNAKPGFVIYDTNYSMVVKPDITGIETKKIQGA